MPAAPQIDLAQAELLDFRAEEGDPKVRVKVADGTVLEITLTVLNIFRSGNDPATGLPIYPIQTNVVSRIITCPKSLRKPSVRPASAAPPTGAAEAR